MIAKVRHELTRRPSTRTVQAPHWPWSHPFFRAGEVEVLAQRIEQGRPGRNFQRSVHAVNFQPDQAFWQVTTLSCRFAALVHTSFKRVLLCVRCPPSDRAHPARQRTNFRWIFAPNLNCRSPLPIFLTFRFVESVCFHAGFCPGGAKAGSTDLQTGVVSLRPRPSLPVPVYRSFSFFSNLMLVAAGQLPSAYWPLKKGGDWYANEDATEE
jgi:hypothetical protein